MNPKRVALPSPVARRTGARDAEALAAEPPENLDDLFTRRSELLLDLGQVEASIARVGTESTCGDQDDSQDVELYDGTLGVSQEFVAEHQAPVGLLKWREDLAGLFNHPGESPGEVNGVSWGTGALIEKDLFLTAGHSFDTEGNGWTRPSRNGRPVPPSELAALMRVTFNFQVDGASPAHPIRPGESFPVTELVEHRLSGLDYAIVRLGPNPAGQLPGDRFGTLPVAAIDPEGRPTLCIIQHPDGAPKRIEAGPMFRNAAGRIEYKTLDTQGVSSGAPILSSLGHIIGVHTTGGCAEFGGANYGTAIGAIREASEVLKRKKRRVVRS